jgi:hypothetical protein
MEAKMSAGDPYVMTDSRPTQLRMDQKTKEAMDFDNWYLNNYKGPVSRTVAKVIWDAAQAVIKTQLMKAFIPKLGE